MNDSKVPEAEAAGSQSDADHLLRALDAMEGHADAVSEKLSPFDKPNATMTAKDLTKVRESLKRINARVGISTALAERISAEEGEGPKAVLLPEDEMFPMEHVSDSVTGLPSKVIGEKAIESAVLVGRPRYAAVFALDRICHMSKRYGVDVGNQALRHCALFLNQKMPSDALLVRWRGAAYVILFDISGTIGGAKLLMEQIAIQKVKFNFVTNDRTAMVNLTVSFTTLALADHQAAATVTRLIDDFVVNHSGRQPI